MLQALPKKYAEVEVVFADDAFCREHLDFDETCPACVETKETRAEMDPEKVVRAIVRPLRTFASVQVRTKNSDGDSFNAGGYTIDLIRYQLRSLSGIQDPDTGKAFELEFGKDSIGDFVTHKTLDRLPDEVQTWLAYLCAKSSKLSEKERQDLNFTGSSASQSAEKSAQETNQSVL